MDELDEFRHQLHMARYYVHKLRVKQYADAMQQGMTPEYAKSMYEKAMRNYDWLIKLSKNGTVTAADEADMTKGFPYG